MSGRLEDAETAAPGFGPEGQEYPMKRKYSSTIASLAVTLSFACGVSAADIIWVGYQNNCMQSHPDVGSFFHGDNWLNFVVPGANDSAIFGSGVDPQGNGVRPHTLHFGDFCLNVSNCPNPIPVPGGNAVNVWLVIQSDSWTFDFDPGSVGNCQRPGNAGGSYTVTGGVIIGDRIQQTGQPGTAALTVRGSGAFHQNGSVVLGQVAGSGGSIVLADPSVSWQTGGPIIVGRAGSGAMAISQGARIGAEWCRLGESATGSGSMSIAGPNSSCDLAGDLWVGGDGPGDLAVSAGGRITAGGWSLLAAAPDSVATVTLDGAGTSWSTADFITLGLRGEGTVRVAAGAEVIAATCFLGQLETGSGSLTVTGRNSACRLTRDLTVGNTGTGILSIAGAGIVTVQTGTCRIAGGSSAEGELEVTGRNSALNVGGELWVGGDGDGVLAVEQGGAASATGWSSIGVGAGSRGAARVTGRGSSLDVGRWLNVGQSGVGTLVIESGASVRCGEGSSIGLLDGAEGSVTVRGKRSRWTSAADVAVGNQGSGLLSIDDGGRVDVTGLLRVALHADHAGTVRVSGADSRLDVNGRIHVGEAGDGRLTLDGSAIVAADTLAVRPTGKVLGSGTVDAVVENSGEVRPGLSAGRLTIGGEYRQTAGGTLLIELGGSEPAEEHDQLAVHGPVTLAGTLDLTVINGYEPALGDRFDVLTYARRAGTFEQVDGRELGGGLTLRPVYGQTGLTLVVGTDVNCEELRKFAVKCSNGRLTASVKSSLAPNTPLIIDNDGDLAVMTVKGNGKGKVRFKNQSGEHRVTVVDCPENERTVACGG